jgi:pyridoxamine 5'-phosphate oxidase
MEPNAMTLATATASGRPSARIVLLKSFDHQGFVFFTNYESRKANHLAENPNAALLFCWLELERQIRIEGRVEKVDEAESLEYFQSRPKESQIGAWASPQSRVIPNRSFIEEKVQAIQNQYFTDDLLPLPPFWGGYRVIPDRFEFWQGRESRLHDRIVYQQAPGKQEWQIVRLGP